MKNNNHLTSGEEYSLKDLFSGNWKIVIPDLQRDYCWGRQTYDQNKKGQGQLVTQFIEGIIDGYKKGDAMTLGILYGYEEPKGQIQLCDGQQRLTTLYLMLGVLNMMANHNRQLESLLMTDFEKKDDQEPQLQYAIRESTLSFLSDLVYHCFIMEDHKVENITDVDWYYREYDQDASIQAIISAVKHIEDALYELRKRNYELSSFVDFVINKLHFVYFDMGDRLHGEETFVVINTTGEPLTATENLKPVLIGNLKDESQRKQFSDEWEEREDWFWKHRNKDKEATSDNLSNDFYVWYWQLQLLQEKVWKEGTEYDILPKDMFLKKTETAGDESEEYDSTHRWNDSLANVHRRFRALKKLYETIDSDEKLKKVLSSFNKAFDNKAGDDIVFIFNALRKNADMLLPLISFCEKFGDYNSFKHDIFLFSCRMAKNVLDKKYGRVRRNDSETTLDWRYVVQIIEQAENIGALLSFDSLRDDAFSKKIPNVKVSCWFDHDERMKRSFYNFVKDSASEEEADRIILQYEGHPSILFDMSVLWSEIDDGSWTQDSVRQLQNRFDNFRLLYDSIDNECATEGLSHSDDVRLSNFYRLYRFLCEWSDAVGHINYHTRDASGMSFGRYDYLQAYNNEYQDKRFSSLLSSQDLVVSLQKAVREEYKESDIIMTSETFTPANYLRVWLLLKVLAANKAEEKITYWTAKAIGCYKNAYDNRININCEFSVGNSSAGYIYRDGVRYADKNGHDNPVLLDRPLYAPGKIADYDSFKNRQVPDDILKCNDAYITEIFNDFLKSADEQGR